MFFKDDTICAIATAMIDAGIGIIRVSGERAIEITNKLYIDAKGNHSLTNYQSHTINYGYIVDENDNKIDEIMISVMKAPRSYTKEDVVEINSHGGRLIMESILNLLIKNGCRMAEPGEFTKRAFLNGRIDLTRAEAVMDLIHAQNEFSMKNIIKGENPRARMAPIVEYDWDREGIDLYQGPPQVYLRRSKYEDSFFKDYDRGLFLGLKTREMRMDVGFKVRVNTKSQQLDTYNGMELYCRNGATQYEYISVDFHVPKYIMLSIADRAGFKIENSQVIDVLDFIHYLNAHSELPFLFKMRAINQQPEYFIRINNLYTHIAVRDKLNLDDGEREGKLDINFGIEMATVLDMPIPHYYSYYSAEPIMSDVKVVEANEGCVAIYSINIVDIPETNELGWNLAAVTEYQTDKDDIEIDMAPIFAGDNPLSRAINHDLTVGISPDKFIDLKLFRDDDISKVPEFKMDWTTMKLSFRYPQEEEMLQIAIYYDTDYINELEATLGKYMETRVGLPN